MTFLKGYGAQSAEEKQRLFKLMRNLNFNGESGSEPYTPTAQTSSGAAVSDGFYSPEFRGDFGAGLLDLHAMDDTELLSEVGPFKVLCIWLMIWFLLRKLKLYYLCEQNFSFPYFLYPLFMVFYVVVQHVMSEPFEPSPFMPDGTRAFDNDLNVTTSRQQRVQPDIDTSILLPVNEKETTKETNVAKIKVVVCWLYNGYIEK